MIASQVGLIREVKERATALASVVLYVASYHYSYKYLISPAYSYQGFVYQPLGFYVVLTAYILSLLPVMFMPLHLRKPSSFVVWMLYLMVYVPSLLTMAFVLGRPLYEMGPFLLSLLVSMLLLALVVRFPIIPLPMPRIPGWLFWGGLGVYLVGSYGLLIDVFGFNGLASLSNVYDVRLKARATLAGAGRLVGYQLRWLSEAINPYLMATGLSEKKTWLFVMGAIGQVIIYSFDATKSTLGSIVLIAAVFFLVTRSFRLRASSLALAFTALFWVVALADGMYRVGLTGLLTRRLFAVPGLLTSVYYDFFSSHDRFYWLHTTYAKLLGMSGSNYPDYKSPGFLIGDVFFGNPEGNANANLWADGYANAGILGVLLVTVIFMAILWIYDSVSFKKDIRVALLLIAMPTFAITNTSLLTALLSHGWLPAIFLLWFSGGLQKRPRRSDNKGGCV